VLFGSADKVLGICSRKRPELWPEKWILHHDSAPTHDVLRVHEFLAKKSIKKMGPPPYSPDLAPVIFGSFRD
jgi:transposase